MAQVGDLTHRVGQPALVERLQEQVPDVGVRFLELVEQDDGERLLAHALDRANRLGRAAAVLPRILPIESGVWNSLMSSRIMPLDRAEQKFGHRLGELGLAGAGRTGEQKDADRLVGIVQAGLEHGDAVDDRVDRLVLADHARGEEIAHRFEVELLPGVEDRDRQAGELRQRFQHAARRDRLVRHRRRARGQLEHEQRRARQAAGAEVLRRRCRARPGRTRDRNRMFARLGHAGDARRSRERQCFGGGQAARA